MLSKFYNVKMTNTLSPPAKCRQLISVPDIKIKRIIGHFAVPKSFVAFTIQKSVVPIGSTICTISKEINRYHKCIYVAVGQNHKYTQTIKRYPKNVTLLLVQSGKLVSIISTVIFLHSLNIMIDRNQNNVVCDV